MSSEKAKDKYQMKYLILILSCVTIFSGYFIIDIPALLKQELIQKFSEVYSREESEIYFSLLYSFYSIPNIVLPIFGGYFSDKYGNSRMTVIYTIIIFLGQCVVCLGVQQNSIFVMILGRFIFGIGGESINISVQALIINWFKGGHISLAQSINLSFIRVASILNTLITPKLAEYQGIEISFAFGFLVCLVSLLSGIILYFIDQSYYPIPKEVRSSSEPDDQSSMQKISSLLKELISGISRFNEIFWCLTVLMVLFYLCVVTFNTFSSSIVTELWLKQEFKSNSIQQNQSIAGELMAIPYICASLLLPIFGLFTDTMGQRVNLLVVSAILILAGQILILFVYPTLTFVLIGLAYAIFGAIVWTSVSFLVKQENLGQALGLMNAIQNLLMGLVPVVIALLLAFTSPIIVVYFFILLSALTLYYSIKFYQLDQIRLVSLNEKDQVKLMNYLNQENSDDKDIIGQSCFDQSSIRHSNNNQTNKNIQGEPDENIDGEEESLIKKEDQQSL